MNRQQAEHILDAYVQTVKFVDDEEPSVALREVILDAMTEYRTTYNPGITLSPWTTANPPKPLVTYTTADKMPTVAATFSGIDPLFKQQTTGVGE